jgi:hypothetical protein
MARKRLKCQSTGLFDVPERSDNDDEVAVLGGPTGDGSLFGDPGHSSGLFDAPHRASGELPGLFDRPRPAGKIAGLFDKPAPAAGGGLFDRPRRAESKSCE